MTIHRLTQVTLDLGEWLGIVSLVLVLIFGVLALVAARRYGTRRRKVLFAFSTAPLLPVGQPPGLLEITYRSFPVPDPHLVTFRVTNVGPLDIASEHFDSNRPLLVRLNCTLYGVTATTHPDQTVSPPLGTEAVIALEPMLIRRGEEWVIEAVVEGDSMPELESSLIDTDVVSGPSALAQWAQQASSSFTVTFRRVSLSFLP